MKNFCYIDDGRCSKLKIDVTKELMSETKRKSKKMSLCTLPYRTCRRAAFRSVAGVRFVALMALLCVQSAAAATWYVSANGGSNSNSGKSAEAPKATIQAAINAAANGDTILVGDGTYGAIVTTNRLLHIKSLNGVATTIIDGGGSGACVNAAPPGDPIYVTGGCTNTVIEGFTIQNGSRGCAGGTINRCIIKSCSGAEQGAGAQASILNNCLLWNNAAYSMGGAAAYCVLRNCTVYGNRTNLGAGGIYTSVATNTILYSNSAQIYPDSLDSTLVSCYSSNPKFVNSSSGNFRLASNSPCINAGKNSGIAGLLDLDGNKRIFGSAVDIGCYEYGSSKPVVPTEIEAVSAKQRYPWNGLIDISFTVNGEVGASYALSIRAKDMAGGGTNLPIRSVFRVDGSSVNVAGEAVQAGTCHWVWDAAADLPKDFTCERVTVEVKSE